jgi:hypothetical protein
MHAVQQPLNGSAWEETMGPPAWKSFPSWFLVAEGNQTIPPDAQRQFAARMGATTTALPLLPLVLFSLLAPPGSQVERARARRANRPPAAVFVSQQ